MKLLKKNKGFTVVELVIVIGVIAVLSAILIPTFVNVTENAKKTALKSNLANAYSAYVSEAGDGFYDGVYSANDGKTLAAIKLVGQDEAYLKNGDNWYEFDDEWKVMSSAPTGAQLVVESCEHYYKADGTENTQVSQTSLSTFNNFAAVYYVPAE